MVMAELGLILAQGKYDFALLQEPYVNNGKVCGLPSGTRIFAAAGRPKSAVVVVGDFAAMPLLSLNSDCISVVSCSGPMDLLLVSLYCRFGDPIEFFTNQLDVILDSAAGRDIVIGMDANASSRTWYSKNIRRGALNAQNGVILEEWLVGRELLVLNEPSEDYTFNGPIGSSDIDLTLFSGGTRCDFTWRVDPAAVTSDHSLIAVTILAMHNPTPPVQASVGWRIPLDPCWLEYCRDVAVRAHTLGLNGWMALGTEAKAATLDAWITATNDEHFPRKGSRGRSIKVRWWNGDLHKQRGKVRRLRRRAQRDRRRLRESPVTAALRRETIIYKQMIKDAKNIHWQNFVSDHGNSDPWGQVYKFCRGNRSPGDLCSLLVGGVPTTTWSESAAALLEEFFPPSVAPVDRVCFPTEQEFEWEEVADAFERTKSRGAPGLDGFVGVMLRAVWSAIPLFIKEFFDGCLLEGIFPDRWKQARVIFLLKSPSKPRSNPRSYRPISLLPILGKTLERALVARLRRASGPHPAQFGFVRGRSTDDALCHVSREVSRAPTKYLLGLFIDFKGAFDYLEWGVILDKLRRMELPELPLWVDYFRDRTVLLTSQAGSVSRSVERGCPQGSISGPAIWNLMLDDLLTELIDDGFLVVAYADDLLVMVPGNSRIDLERRAAEALVPIHNWGNRVGVDVSRDKSVAMLLKGRLNGRNPTIRMAGHSLACVTEVRYLGILIGERMSFHCHFRHVREKLTSTVAMFRRVLRRDWGLGRSAIQVLMRGLFQACALYGAPLWWQSAITAKGSLLINSCQRVVLYACAPVCRTVSTAAMQVLMGVLPWDLEAVRVGITYLRKRDLEFELAYLNSADLRGLGRKEVKALLDRVLWEEWQLRWSRADSGAVTRLFVPEVSTLRDRHDLAWSRFVCFLVTGHGSLNAFLKSRNLVDSELCRCGGLEDWEHVLLHCVEYEDIRDLYLMGIYNEVDGTYYLPGCLGSARSFLALKDFAREAFERRSSSRPPLTGAPS